MGQKIAFGLGMLANQMFPAALGIFMVVLVQDLGFPPGCGGLSFFFPEYLMLLSTLSWVSFLTIPGLNGEDGDIMCL